MDGPDDEKDFDSEQVQNIAWRELGGVYGFQFSQLMLTGIHTNRTHLRRMTPRKG